MKDWTGNKVSAFKTIGATGHGNEEREENDYYATDPKAVEILLENETFGDFILEPACGEGHISEVLKSHGYNVYSTDLIDRGYADSVIDFFDLKGIVDGDIITNPPYRFAREFVEHSLSLIPDKNKVAMFLKITFLEGVARRKLFNTSPPKTIYVFSGRIRCAKNGDFENATGNAILYAWFIWEKGFKGNPIIKWVN